MEYQEIGRKFINSWMNMIENNNHDNLKELFNMNSILWFHSPVVHNVYKGFIPIELILQNVLQVFIDFKYINDGYITPYPIPQDKKQNKDSKSQVIGVILLFQASVIDIDTKKKYNIEGVDIFEVDINTGKAEYLKVMVRPLNGAIALAKQMKLRMQGKL